jgi:hypothetical protein
LENDIRELECEANLSLKDKDSAKPAANTYAPKEWACIASMLYRTPRNLHKPGALEQKRELIRIMLKSFRRREIQQRPVAFDLGAP